MTQANKVKDKATGCTVRQLFGTDGIRGAANTERMSAELALRAGQAVGAVFRNGHRGGRIVVGKDTRLSGDMIESAIASGLASTGMDVLLVGALPTPGIAFITASMRAAAGVVISASHNPFSDNGIKLFDPDGYKLPDEVELQLEQYMLEPDLAHERLATPESLGHVTQLKDATGRYIVSLKSCFPRGMTLNGMKIVLDCANGATYKVAPEVMYELGAETITIGDRPNGTNINRGVGSTHPEAVAHQVTQHGADIGIAFDGDGDRVIFVDHEGNVVDGDTIMAVCGVSMIAEGTLRNNTVVGTIMSNLGLEIALRKHGGALVRTAVGDRYVMEAMLNDGYNFGGEQSGHMIFRDHSTTGDGILAALQVLAMLRKQDKSLKDLATVMEHVPQYMINISAPAKPPLDQMPAVSKAIAEAEADLGDDGRIVVRYSGTEPKVRIMAEGLDAERIRVHCDAIASEFEAEIVAHT